MTYFENNYDKVRYPIRKPNEPGLRRAQIGAIHRIASYFTTENEPAIVVMPTGSGKTAVLMISAKASKRRVFRDFGRTKK